MYRLLALGVTLLASLPLHAQLSITQYSDRALWEAAVSGVVTESFNGEATGSFTTRNFADFTVVNEDPPNLDTEIRDGTDGTNVNGSNFLYFEASCCDQPNGMAINLDRATKALGFDWRNTDGSGDIAQLVIVVDGQSFAFGPPGSGFFGIVSSGGDGGGFDSVLIKDTVGQGGRLGSLGIDDFSYVDAEPFATFVVDFSFADGNDWDSTIAHISCNGGLPLTSEQTVEDGDTLTFVLEFPEAGAGDTDCDIWVDNVGGYTADYVASGNSSNDQDGLGCHFFNVDDGDKNFCDIDMDPDQAFLTVYKTWDVLGSVADVYDIDFDATIGACANQGVIVNSFYSSSQGRYCVFESVEGPGDDFVTFTINTQHDGDTIYINERVFDSAIEVDSSDCPNFTALPGGDYDCTIVNTVFFEGIPTLNQYGLAIMVLLMLGVGFVGFRRFV